MHKKVTSRSFSLQGYHDLLSRFINAGYRDRLFSELDPGKQHVVFRHDVDFSMRAALDVARVEANLGIRAHYFVLLRTEFYNLCSPTDWSLVKEIDELGHDFGLHFDASQYSQDLTALETAAEHECLVLEAILQKPVTAISFHRPAEALLGLDRDLAGRLHAYQPRFFSEISYCSDSQGAFRFGHPFDQDAFHDGKAMQLLTHPIWWQEAVSENHMHILDDLHDARSALLRQELASNCKPYATYISKQTERNTGL